MIKLNKILSLTSCLLLSYSSIYFNIPSDSRRLLFRDQNTEQLVLYEFEDLNRDGNVEVCVSGDPERKLNVYSYFSKEHASTIEHLTGLSLSKFIGYSSRGNVYPHITTEVIVMGSEEQKIANHLFTLAQKLDR